MIWNRHDPEWTRSEMDMIRNGHNLDMIRNRHDPE